MRTPTVRPLLKPRVHATATFLICSRVCRGAELLKRCMLVCALDHMACHGCRKERTLQAATSVTGESPARSVGRLRTSPQGKLTTASASRLGQKRRASSLLIPTEGLGVPPEKPPTPPAGTPRSGGGIPLIRSPKKGFDLPAAGEQAPACLVIMLSLQSAS